MTGAGVYRGRLPGLGRVEQPKFIVSGARPVDYILGRFASGHGADLIAGQQVPSLGDVAAALRALADTELNRAMLSADVLGADPPAGLSTFLQDVGRALAADLAGAGPDLTWAARRLWDRVSSDYRLWSWPSRGQAGAVLVALAGREHAEVMLSRQVRDLGAEDDCSGDWAHIVGLSRYLRLVAEEFVAVGRTDTPVRVLARRPAV